MGEGYRTSTPPGVTYSSVVRKDSVRILLMIAALNDIDVLGADVKNAFLNAPCKEKVWVESRTRIWRRSRQDFISCKGIIWTQVGKCKF